MLGNVVENVTTSTDEADMIVLQEDGWEVGNVVENVTTSTDEADIIVLQEDG